MAKTLLLILVFPLLLGLWLRKRFPRVIRQIEKFIRILSFIILAMFIGFALVDNKEVFINYIKYILLLVFLHNLLALVTGFFFAKIMKLESRDVRTITIETGIQNSGLGLLIIFTFFNGLGPMALITAWWGIWHLFSGVLTALIFQRFKFTNLVGIQ